MNQCNYNFAIANLALQCGVTLSAANLVYQTYGELNSDKSNVILYPTSYGAQHPDIEWLSDILQTPNQRLRCWLPLSLMDLAPLTALAELRHLSTTKLPDSTT